MRADPLGLRVEGAADAAAVEDADGSRWSCSELYAAEERVAGRLAEAGLLPGDVVLGLVPRTPAGVAIVRGAVRAGCALALADPRWSQREVESFRALVGPRALLHVGQPRRGLEGLDRSSRREIELPERDPGRRERLAVTRFEGAERWTSDPGADERAGSRARPSETLIRTSGSGGTPRAVRLDPDNHRASARATTRRMKLVAEDRLAASLSFAHVGGVALIWRAAASGARLVTAGDRFEPTEWNRLIDTGRVTVASVVPVALRRLLDDRGERSPPPGFRGVLVGGAACPASLIERAFDAGFPVWSTYGLTEAASQVATAPPERVRRKPGGVGRPLSGTEVCPGPDGELLVRGPTVMRGYLEQAGRGRPAVTAESIAGRERLPATAESTAGRLTEDGWLHTGDAGYLDEDGDLWISGRLDNRILTGGETVGPQEIEACLVSHPAVREAAVVGLPDEEWGERVVAVVRLEPGCRVETAELDAFARENLSGGRRPRGWLVVRELPRTANGKLDRAATRQLAARDANAVDGGTSVRQPRR